MDQGKNRRTQDVGTERPRRLRRRTAGHQARLHQRAVLFRPHAQVHNPLVEPRCLQRPRRHFGQRGCRVRAAQRAEGALRLRANIRIVRIRRCTHARENQECYEVRLVEHVDVRVRSQVATHPHIPICRVEPQMAIVPTSNGSVNAYASGTTQLILDISSYFAP